MEAERVPVSEDGGAEVQEGLLEDEGRREELLEQVDFREGVVEAAIGVAEESSDGLGERLEERAKTVLACAPTLRLELRRKIIRRLKPSGK